jgi:hypothetical protein
MILQNIFITIFFPNKKAYFNLIPNWIRLQYARFWIQTVNLINVLSHKEIDLIRFANNFMHFAFEKII